MRKTILTAIAAVSLISAQAPTVDAILDSIEKNENAETSRIEMIQRVYRANGSIAESELTSYSSGKGEKGIIIYSKPARINGMKVLNLNDGDDIWFYSPRTSRTRKIASHQKNQSVNGSDFSYDDLNTKDRRDDFDSKITGEESTDKINCKVIEMSLKADAKSSYSKIIMNVDTSRWLPLKTSFYDEEGELWKVLTMDEISKIGNYWSAGKIIMTNEQKGSRTEMITKKVEFDLKVDEKMFTERYLSR